MTGSFGMGAGGGAHAWHAAMAVPAAQPARCRVCERLGGRAADWRPLQWLGPIRRAPGSRDGPASIVPCRRSHKRRSRRACAQSAGQPMARGMPVPPRMRGDGDSAAPKPMPGASVTPCRPVVAARLHGRCVGGGLRHAVGVDGVACRARRAPFRFNFPQSTANPAWARAEVLALGRFHFHDAHDVDMAGAEPSHRGAPVLAAGVEPIRAVWVGGRPVLASSRAGMLPHGRGARRAEPARIRASTCGARHMAWMFSQERTHRWMHLSAAVAP
ncbi:hypothetical protein GO282_04341 [Ralstonia solanacearum]|nr:hypothetical protein [Ralstonia solanacearum]